MSEDGPTLVQFKSGWELIGTSPDGLPAYRQTTIVRMDRPPYLSIERVADEQDIEDHPMPYRLFRKEQDARKQSHAEGYPLALWPAVNEAEFRMLVDRDIVTVEQLAAFKDTRNLPAELKDLAGRAKKMIELQKGAGKYEEILRERDGRIEALTEQVRDASLVIAQQRTELDSLRIRHSGVGYNTGAG